MSTQERTLEEIKISTNITILRNMLSGISNAYLEVKEQLEKEELKLMKAEDRKQGNPYPNGRYTS